MSQQEGLIPTILRVRGRQIRHRLQMMMGSQTRAEIIDARFAVLRSLGVVAAPRVIHDCARDRRQQQIEQPDDTLRQRKLPLCRGDLVPERHALVRGVPVGAAPGTTSATWATPWTSSACARVSMTIVPAAMSWSACFRFVTSAVMMLMTTRAKPMGNGDFRIDRTNAEPSVKPEPSRRTARNPNATLPSVAPDNLSQTRKYRQHSV